MNTSSIGSAFVAIIIILTMILVGVMVYFDVAETGQFPQQSEVFADTTTANTTHTLQYAPRDSTSTYFSGTWYNSSDTTWSAISADNLTLSGNRVTFTVRTLGADSHAYEVYQNLSQVNFSYYTRTGAVVNDDVTPSAETVFTIAPIVAIVVIASLILYVVGGFGKRESF